jgi:hypothetical protein
MTIVIPMLGDSKRFFQKGYKVPKYMLQLGKSNLFVESVKSFERYFESENFIFVIREDHGAHKFVMEQIAALGIKSFIIITHNGVTQGQAESVYLAINNCASKSGLIIFNIDTIRLNFEMPAADTLADGFLEVFNAIGDGWSFVLPGEQGMVLKTAEKNRISNLCSNGLYYFAEASFFREAYEANNGPDSRVKGELFVAPLYNYLIADGKKITYREVPNSYILNCGTPADYEEINNIYIRY